MKLHEKLNIQLPAIDHSMAEVVLSDQDLPASSVIRDSVLRLIESGGKRIRPMLVLVGGRFGCMQDQRKLLRTAVLLEYMHMASLVHDDIIDAADTRRNDITLHRKTDAYTAALIADYMVARALEWAFSIQERHSGRDDLVSANLAALAAPLCLGEYGQLRNAYRYDLSLKQYLKKTRRKTALLMAACLKAGAEVADADAKTANLLHQIGDAIGMAFQIQDDILDFVQTNRTLGKPAGADLRNGNITLPVLYALDIPELEPVIRKLQPDSPDGDYRRVIEAIAVSPAIAQAAAVRDRYIERAERLIGLLSHHPAHEDLIVLLEYVSRRSA